MRKVHDKGREPWTPLITRLLELEDRLIRPCELKRTIKSTNEILT